MYFGYFSITHITVCVILEVVQYPAYCVQYADTWILAMKREKIGGSINKIKYDEIKAQLCLVNLDDAHYSVHIHVLPTYKYKYRILPGVHVYVLLMYVYVLL